MALDSEWLRVSSESVWPGSTAGTLTGRQRQLRASPLQTRCKPVASLLQARCKPAANPLQASCKPAASPLQARCKPAASPLQASCKPVASPLQASVSQSDRHRADSCLESGGLQAQLGSCSLCARRQSTLLSEPISQLVIPLKSESTGPQLSHHMALPLPAGQ
jgi:hypothetical protein